MRKYLLAVVYSVVPFITTAQVVSEHTVDGNEVVIYRLDDVQKDSLATVRSSAIVDYYKLLERNLDYLLRDAGNNDPWALEEAKSLLSAIAGYDYTPNLEELIAEYNVYLRINDQPPYELSRKGDEIVDATDSLDYLLTTDTSITFPHHDYGAKYAGNNYNRVVDRLEGFIINEMKYSRLEDMTNDNQGNIIQAFQNNGINVAVKTFQVKYYLRMPLEADMTIEKIEIFGDWEPIVQLFCFYWPTTINFDDRTRGATATRRYSSDYIKIISDYPRAIIEITGYE